MDRHARGALAFVMGLAFTYLSGCRMARPSAPLPPVGPEDAAARAVAAADTAGAGEHDSHADGPRALKITYVDGAPYPRRPWDEVELRSTPRARRCDDCLVIARSRNARTLWLARYFDDGSEYVDRFSVGSDIGRGGVLQFVDGFTESAAAGSGVPAGRTGPVSSLRIEAWVVYPKQGLIVRPKNGQTYPLRAARGAGSAEGARRLQWMAFVPSCPQAPQGCVYYGKAREVVARYEQHFRGPQQVTVWGYPGACRRTWSAGRRVRAGLDGRDRSGC